MKITFYRVERSVDGDDEYTGEYEYKQDYNLPEIQQPSIEFKTMVATSTTGEQVTLAGKFTSSLNLSSGQVFSFGEMFYRIATETRSAVSFYAYGFVEIDDDVF